jgi:hypothetical protein
MTHNAAIFFISSQSLARTLQLDMCDSAHAPLIRTLWRAFPCQYIEVNPLFSATRKSEHYRLENGPPPVLERFSSQCGRVAAVVEVSQSFLGREGVD